MHATVLLSYSVFPSRYILAVTHRDFALVAKRLKKYNEISRARSTRSWDQTAMIVDDSLSKSCNVLAQLFIFLAFLVLSFTMITRCRNIFFVFDTLTPSLASDSDVFSVS